MMLILESSQPEVPELEIEADVSVVHLLEDDALVMAGNDALVIEILGRSFRVSAGSFFQVNTAMAEKMVQHILAQVQVSKNTTVMDVYCGVGLFSAFLADQAGRLIGIEASPAACEDFTANLDEFEHVDLFEAPAEDVLPYLDVSLDVILVDPPRAGLDPRVLDAILARGPGTVAYVSCDPSTLARDAMRLVNGGYHLKQITPFDLFPQTFHIETISIFERFA
jgi:23S rRNA (uracil1939-C5)-methyltransferase